MNRLYDSNMPKSLLRARESSGATPPLADRTRERLGGVVESKGSDGTFKVRIITEGKGSSAIYSRELIQNPSTATVMDGLKSFFDHPDYSFAPEERSVLSLAGRFVPGTLENGDTEDGLAAAYGKFKPRKEYAEFFEEFADVLGVSIFLAATFTETSSGERVVASFVDDPYNSIDIVVAAGRGGRFESAQESLRTIESSLGNRPASKPSTEASVQEEEGNMLTKEDVTAIVAEAVKPLVDALSGLTTAATEKATAEATAEAIDTAVTEALTGYDEKVAAIAAEKDLLKSQREALTESARKGNDITAELVDALAFATEAKAAFAAEAAADPIGGGEGFVLESGQSTEGADDSALLNKAVEGV